MSLGELVNEWAVLVAHTHTYFPQQLKKINKGNIFILLSFEGVILVSWVVSLLTEIFQSLLFPEDNYPASAMNYLLTLQAHLEENIDQRLLHRSRMDLPPDQSSSSVRGYPGLWSCSYLPTTLSHQGARCFPSCSVLYLSDYQVPCWCRGILPVICHTNKWGKMSEMGVVVHESKWKHSWKNEIERCLFWCKICVLIPRIVFVLTMCLFHIELSQLLAGKGRVGRALGCHCFEGKAIYRIWYLSRFNRWAPLPVAYTSIRHGEKG